MKPVELEVAHRGVELFDPLLRYCLRFGEAIQTLATDCQILIMDRRRPATEAHGLSEEFHDLLILPQIIAGEPPVVKRRDVPRVHLRQHPVSLDGPVHILDDRLIVISLDEQPLALGGPLAQLKSVCYALLGTLRLPRIAVHGAQRSVGQREVGVQLDGPPVERYRCPEPSLLVLLPAQAESFQGL